MNFNGQKLFQLLPALYRGKDGKIAQSTTLLTAAEAAQLSALQNQASPLSATQQFQLDQLAAKAARGPLQSLLMLIEEQMAVMAEDLDQLYDDQFIETCAPWIIPYIGDLIGYQLVNGVAPAVASPRAQVAHTISLRRRKGTILVLEQLARDVTGWGAHSVEFFKLLADTQYMNHIRPNNHYAPNLRRWEVREYMDSGFDGTAHKVDVRRIAVERGRYNIQNIGVFLWSLNSYSLTKSPAPPVNNVPQCFRFSPVGSDMPLFNRPITQGSEIAVAALPVNVPDRLRRRVLCRDIAQAGHGATPVYYGLGNSVVLYLDGKLVDVSRIQVCNLSGDDGSWLNVPVAGSKFLAAIDPELGRIALPPVVAPAKEPVVVASFCYGFNADMSGGEYPRENSLAVVSPEQSVIRVPGDYSGIQAALDALGGDGVVEITDSNTYNQTTLSVNVKTKGHIQLQARDGFRPTIFLNGEMTIAGGPNSEFDLNGLLITSKAAPANPSPSTIVRVPAKDSSGNANQLSHLRLAHTTLVPGWALTPRGAPQNGAQPALVAETPGLETVIQKSILGGLWVHPLATANLADSILDATSPTNVAYATLDGAGPGGALTLTGCTVIGKVHAALISLVSDTIFCGALASGDSWPSALVASRKQEGCVRFSYLPGNPIVPRQFECVAEGRGTPGPLFYSLRYGSPGYAKLLPDTDDIVRRGADDGGEMGAFHFVLAPQRETDLRVRTQEFLPVGLEFGIFYET